MNIRALVGGLITTLFLGFSAEAQTISLFQPTGLTACTGDSLLLELQIAVNPMQPTNSFKVLYAPGPPSAFTLALSDTAQIVKLQSILPVVGTDSNSLGTKYVWVVVPESITTGGIFSIVVKSSAPSLWSDTIQLVVSVSPTSIINSIAGGFNNLHTNVKDWGFCEGDTVRLTANPSQVGYQWYKDGVPLPGATSVNLDVFNSGTYSVETFNSTNGGCPKMSKDTVVNMFTPSTAVVHLPGSMTTIKVLDADATIDSVGFCETETIQLQGPSTTAAGTSVLYQWLRDSTNAFGQAITVPVLGSTQQTFSTFTGGTYYLQTTWLPGGCPDTSEAFWLFVDSVPDTEIQALAWPGQPQANLTICADDSTQLAAIAFSNDWTYQWEVRFPAGSGNWTAIPGKTASKLTVSTAIVADDAEYRLIIDNDYCRHTTSELLVTVVALPQVNVAPADSLALCAGDSVLVGATGNSASYLWTFPGGSYSGASFYANTPGTYTVAGTNSNGCTSYDTLKIYFYSVNANAGPDQTILPGTTVQLAASGGSVYYWYASVPSYFSDPYNPNAQTVPTRDTTMYVVEALNSYGCFDTDTMMVYWFDPASLVPDLSGIMNVITPNGDGFNDFFDLSEVVRSDSCDIMIFDRWGAKAFDQKRYISGWDGRSNGGDPLPDGTYYYILTCSDVVRFRGAITVVRL